MANGFASLMRNGEAFICMRSHGRGLPEKCHSFELGPLGGCHISRSRFTALTRRSRVDCVDLCAFVDANLVVSLGRVSIMLESTYVGRYEYYSVRISEYPSAPNYVQVTGPLYTVTISFQSPLCAFVMPRLQFFGLDDKF